MNGANLVMLLVIIVLLFALIFLAIAVSHAALPRLDQIFGSDEKRLGLTG